MKIWQLRAPRGFCWGSIAARYYRFFSKQYLINNPLPTSVITEVTNWVMLLSFTSYHAWTMLKKKYQDGMDALYSICRWYQTNVRKCSLSTWLSFLYLLTNWIFISKNRFHFSKSIPRVHICRVSEAKRASKLSKLRSIVTERQWWMIYACAHEGVRRLKRQSKCQQTRNSNVRKHCLN